MKLTAGISYKEVKTVYGKEKDARVKERLLIILKAFKIPSTYKIAEQVNTTHTKVRRWIHRFNEQGFGGLKDKQRSGRPAYLSDEQKKELEEDLNRPKEFSVGWKTLEVMDYVKKGFGIGYTVRHIRRLLHQLGFSRVKPRPTNVHKDPIKARKIVEELKKNSRVWVKTGQHLQEMNSA